MAKKKKAVGFELSVSGRDDGTLEAVYIHVSDATVSRTKEFKEDILLADYADDGSLVGIEVLAPVRIADLEKIIGKGSLQKAFRKFLSKSAPKELVTA